MGCEEQRARLSEWISPSPPHRMPALGQCSTLTAGVNTKGQYLQELSLAWGMVWTCKGNSGGYGSKKLFPVTLKWQNAAKASITL